MTWKRTVPLLLALSLLLGLCGVALAGIEPSPWHTVIVNRTDRLNSASPFYNQAMRSMQLTVWIAAVGDTIEPTKITLPIGNNTVGDTLAPGQALSVPVALAGIGPGAQILSWSFSAEMGVESAPTGTEPSPMGIEPSPWKVFAFDAKISRPPFPYEAPLLAPSYLTGEMPILGFASPGVVVGTVALVNDEMFYAACPSLPPPGSGWKNHGQYVRCVAQRAETLALDGRIATELADAIVSAAAQSETGKK